MIRFVRESRSGYFAGMTPLWTVATLLFFASILSIRWLNHCFGLGVKVCPLKLAFDTPCPLCGGTTAAVHLAKGQWASAFYSNPLVSLAIPAFLAWSALWLGFRIRATTTLPPAAVASLLLLLLALNWAYVLTTR
ncbi:MAG TPA: DUF2752 domain-containing protein [Bacteroidia bacterium]|nr:DUF2752 domain-containing protein [Bacteroidia bacterium]